MTDGDSDDELLPVEGAGQSDFSALFSGTDDDDGAADGIELDSQQADEVRRIFFTTLPDYLGPVEEMLEQLFSDAGTADLVDPLSGTLESIAQAASRIGIADVAACIELMRDRLLASGGKAPPPEAREGIEAGLEELKAMIVAATGGAPDTGGAGDSPTLFAALSLVEDLDETVMERLAKAGLLTVDQFMSAKAHEVVAVSGLDEATVEKIRSALLAARTRSPEEGAADGDTEARASTPPGRSGGIDSSDLDAELVRRLEAQVEAEAALDQARAALLRTRLDADALREQLPRLQRRREELRATASKAIEALANRVQELGRLRAVSTRIARRKAVAEATAEELEAEVRALREELDEVCVERRRAERELSELHARLRSLVRATLRRFAQ